MVKNLSVVAGLCALSLVSSAGAAYEDEIKAWQKERETKLQAPDNWLSLVGLVWLEKPGTYRVGADPKASVELPAGAARSHVGDFRLSESGEVTFSPAPSSVATIHGKAITKTVVVSSVKTEDAEPIQIGTRLRLIVVRRSKGVGVRIKDSEAPTLKNFRGLSRFPVRPELRVEARLEPTAKTGGKVEVPNILGGTDEWELAGDLVFELGGKLRRLQALREEGTLFIIFRDETSGKTTYPAGRFLYADLPVAGKVVLDFNRAYNPPCAFTKFATCPLPPKSNTLAMAIEAGEQFSQKDHP